MILFVDDDHRRIEHFVRELANRGFQTQVISTVDEAMAFLKSPPASLEALVCDIMMPYGSLDPDATRDGFRSGLILLDTALKAKADLPIVLLTNVTEEKLALPEDLGKYCLYVYKWDGPRQFADRVQSFLGRKERKSDLGDERLADDSERNP
jgi:CheY-like chemotaxis protein